MILKNKFNQKGQIIILALIMPIIFIVALTATISWSASIYRVASVSQNKELAFQIAEAGANYYRWHLAHSPSDYKDGTGQPGPYVHDFVDKDDPSVVIGRYSLEITPPELGSTIVKIKSVGYTLNKPDVKKTVLLTVGKPSFAKYAVVANNDMRFGEGTEIFGPIQVNGGIRFDGLAHNLVSSTRADYDDLDHIGANEFGVHTHRNIPPATGVNSAFRALEGPPNIMQNRPDIFLAGREVGVPVVSFTALSSDLASMKNKAANRIVFEINITDNGTGYTSTPTVEITGGGGANATATAVVNGGKVVALNITNNGTGYTSAPSVAFIGGGGINASATAVVTHGFYQPSSGEQGYHIILKTDNTFDLYKVTQVRPQTGIVTEITVTGQGSGYTSIPTVSVISSDAVAAAGMKVRTISVTSQGNNYDTPPIVNIIGGGGAGAVATATLGGAGGKKVISVAITSYGTGYTTIPTVTFTPTSGGAGAAAVATIGLEVTSLTVVNGGSNYSSEPLVFIRGGGASVNATATSIISGGIITGFTITSGGAGYTSVPTVSIAASDSGALANATIGGVGGDHVISIAVTNGGSGYGAAPAVFITGGGATTNATATAIIGNCDNPTWSINAQTLVSGSPFDFPPNGVMFFEDDLWVDGSLENIRLNIGSSRFAPTNPAGQSSIIINNDIAYVNNDGSEALGLIAEKDINVGLFSEDDLIIDAALIAQNGKVGRKYYSSACGTTYSRAVITLYGMLASNSRYGFSWTGINSWDCGGSIGFIASGYCNRNLNYDANLLYAPPPEFPLTTNQYEVISWEELKN